MQNPLYRNYDNAIEAAGQRGAAEGEKSARRLLASEGLQLVRAVVVAIDANNRVMIRRVHNEEPDPPYYQLLSPAIIPAVGAEIFGMVGGGTLMLMGSEPGPGYVDINGVRQGNLFDESLGNAKFKDGSQDSRTITADGVGYSELAYEAVGHDSVAANVIGAYEVTGNSLGGAQLIDRGVGGINLVQNTVSAGETVNNTFGDQSLVDNGVGQTSIASGSIGFYEMQNDSVGSGALLANAVGNSSMQDGAIGFYELSNDCVGSGAIIENSVSSAQITNYTIGDQSLMSGAIGSRAIADVLNGPGQDSYGLRAIGSGTGVKASGTGHTHSQNWKADFTAEERQSLLADREIVEALDEGELEELLPGLGSLKRMAEAAFRALADEPGGVRAEVVEERLRTDRDYRHDFLLDNDRNYHARWFYEVDPDYRRQAQNNDRILRALELCPSIESRHRQYEDDGARQESWYADWYEEKRTQRPSANEGTRHVEHIGPEDFERREVDVETLEDMTPNEVRAWLDEGNTFALGVGGARYVLRRTEDGSYIVYHYEYSTFDRAKQFAAPYGSHYTLNDPGVDGPPLYDVRIGDQKRLLDDGKCFTAPISNGEHFKLCRMPDGAYIQYIPQRETFEAAMGRVAQFGPASLWEKSDAAGELVSIRGGNQASS